MLTIGPRTATYNFNPNHIHSMSLLYNWPKAMYFWRNWNWYNYVHVNTHSVTCTCINYWGRALRQSSDGSQITWPSPLRLKPIAAVVIFHVRKLADCLQKVGCSTQVDGRAWNNEGAPGIFIHQLKLESHYITIPVGATQGLELCENE